MLRRLIRRPITLTMAVIAIAAPLGVLAAPAGAAREVPKPDPTSRGEHCAVHVTGQLTTRQFTLGTLRCYATQEEARSDTEPIDTGSSDVSALSAGGGAAAASSGDVLLAIHYDGFSGAGSSLAVFGPSCHVNGWINMSPLFNNKISSSSSQCAVWHHDGFNLTGALEYITAPGGNLTLLNNRTSSALYTT